MYVVRRTCLIYQITGIYCEEERSVGFYYHFVVREFPSLVSHDNRRAAASPLIIPVAIPFSGPTPTGQCHSDPLVPGIKCNIPGEVS